MGCEWFKDRLRDYIEHKDFEDHVRKYLAKKTFRAALEAFVFFPTAILLYGNAENHLEIGLVNQFL